ncbi:hypothetical protein [Marinifilum sp. D714]|nr:hypothetical protein [Marinifilum sp. D714]MDQ2180140.1 hypothetical protein [Marinifilum sp. D714]
MNNWLAVIATFFPTDQNGKLPKTNYGSIISIFYWKLSEENHSYIP